jgi:RimJ/RimL family protein N-acetyltransferase
MDRPETQTPIVNFVGARVALGPIGREHISLFQQWNNDLAVTRTLWRSEPWTIEQMTAAYDASLAAADQVHFLIYERASMRPIGSTYLTHIDHRHRTAEFGITIGEAAARGKGYGTEAARLMLDYAFAALGLHNVMLNVYTFNRAGRRAYEKAGFREFARRRESKMMGGGLWDVISMEALASDFVSPVLSRILAPDEPR